MRSRAEPKRRRCALCTGTLCSKTMIGGGLARQLGWHARTPRTAHLCHHFPHGLRRCGVVGSRSLRRSVLFGDGEAGSRQRRGFSRCDKVETVWQAHEMRQVAGHGVVSRQAGRDSPRRRTHAACHAILGRSELQLALTMSQNVVPVCHNLHSVPLRNMHP